IERLERIAPVDVARWIEARASLHAAKLGTDAVAALASAVGSDTERIEQEVKKLGAYAAGATVTAADVRALVSGAIEADVFELTPTSPHSHSASSISAMWRMPICAACCASSRPSADQRFAVGASVGFVSGARPVLL